MDMTDIGALGELIAALATLMTLIYLSAQLRQTNLITKARFGHEITERTYERYFQSAKDNEFSEFLAKDWAKEELNKSDTNRVLNFSGMLLVDIFDIYDKVEQGLVEAKHLDFRIHVLRTGIFRSPTGLQAWNFLKLTREKPFIEWFEENIINPAELQDVVADLNKKDPKWNEDESINIRLND